MNQDGVRVKLQRSSCLRVDDSEEDSELHETPGVSSTDPLTETAGEKQYRNYDQDGRDDFTVDDEKTTDIETLESVAILSA